MAETYTRDKFYALIQALPGFAALNGKIGGVAGTYYTGIQFEDAVSRHANGFWGGMNPRQNVPIGPTSTVRVPNAQGVTALKNHYNMLFMVEMGQIGVREGMVASLLNKAIAGTLANDMNAGRVEPEVNYYVAPAPAVAAPGAPPIPPRPPALINRSKAIAWATRGVVGSPAAFSACITGNIKTDGSLPLGTNEKLIVTMWHQLVAGSAPPPPDFRNTVTGSTYPSSIGGMYLLKHIFTQTTGQAYPALGNADWQNWALFYFSAVMGVQAFPDANKRICRVIYALIMASAGIPFVAPTNAYGAHLAMM